MGVNWLPSPSSQLSPGQWGHSPVAHVGGGHWTASLEDILSSPGWDQPLRLGGRSPISQIHSHCDPSLMPQIWGTRAVASNLSPTCCHLPVQVLCLSSSELQPGQDPEGKWVEPGSILLHPPVLAPSAVAPLLLQPPRQPLPSSCLLSQSCVCLFSESQTRDWGGGE